MVERMVRIHKVRGSIPLISTSTEKSAQASRLSGFFIPGYYYAR